MAVIINLGNNTIYTSYKYNQGSRIRLLKFDRQCFVTHKGLNLGFCFRRGVHSVIIVRLLFSSPFTLLSP